MIYRYIGAEAQQRISYELRFPNLLLTKSLSGWYYLSKQFTRYVIGNKFVEMINLLN